MEFLYKKTARTTWRGFHNQSQCQRDGLGEGTFSNLSRLDI